MGKRARRDIRLSEVVQRIVDEPLEISRRLDLADWLERHGSTLRARWVRRCCAIWDSIQPLLLGLAEHQGLVHAAPWGLVDLSTSDINRWVSIRPNYWAEIPSATQTPYFGRVVLGARADVPESIQGIGETPWLPRAYEEGWLESICHIPANAQQIKALVDWPDSHRVLPIHVNLTAVWRDGVDNGLIRDLLTMEGIHGLSLCPQVFRYSAVKRYGETCRNIRYLQLTGLTKTLTSRRILEQTDQLTKLRSLIVGHNLPDDSTISLLTKIPDLQTLRLYAVKVTDLGLRQLARMKSLQMLAIDLAGVSRAGIYTLRESRPDLTVIVEGRLRERLGPV